MILTSLTLKNFRCHASLQLKMTEGLIGVIGDNGKGKSSIIEAILFLFTGEGYKDKDSMINRTTVGDSWVAGTFELNGKPGKIQRWVSASKVRLEYGDEEPLTKASEVKEAWAKYLQIDNHIFRHVIIASQGAIAELFSGDTSVREKAFQKIFMVPNTERLRTVIWEKFLKTAPPLEFEENLEEITKQQTDVKAQRAAIEQQYLELTAKLDAKAYATWLATVQQLKLAMQRRLELPALEMNIKNIQSKIAELQPKVATPFDHQRLNTLVNNVNDMNVKAEQYRMRDYYEKEREKLNQICGGQKPTKEFLNQLQAQKQQLQAEAEDLARQLWTEQSEQNKAKQYLSTAKDVCPTCGQSIVTNAQHIAETKEKLKLADVRVRQLADSNNAAKARLKDVELEFNRKADIYNKDEMFVAQLNNTPVVNYNAQIHSTAKQELQLLMKVQQDDTNTRTQMQTLVDSLNKLEAKKAQIPQMDETLLQSSLQYYQAEIDQYNSQTEIVNGLRSQMAYHDSTLAQIANRLQQQLQVRKRNEKTKLYTENLKTAYDALHASKFPRFLINTYTDIVEEALQLQLQQFDLPYKLNIKEGFKFEIVDEHDHIIPDLSGGQEVVAGLCLRLALHSLFGQSFPMLVIDEGTTHLSAIKKIVYFDVLRRLREDKTIKQMIVIDHDDRLEDCVDFVLKF